MTHGFVLFDDWLVILLVRSTQFVCLGAATNVAEEFGLLEVLLLAGCPEQFNQPDLNFLVPRRLFKLICRRAKGFANQVSAFGGDVQKRTLACSLEVSHSRFVQMSQVVQFMTAGQLRPPSWPKKIH